MAEVSGGEAADAYLARLSDQLGKGNALRVGFLEGATYPDGTPVALVAAVQNFGSPSRGIPPRAFFSNMIADKSPLWGPSFAAILEHNGGDITNALGLMGEMIAGDLRQSIRDTNEPPLSQATIHRKGFAKPLIDSGHMFNSVSYEVSDESASTIYDWNLKAQGFVERPA